MKQGRRISAVFEHEDGYRWEQAYDSKVKFGRAVRSLKRAVWVHAVDYTEGIAIRPSNLWGYLHS